MNFDQLQTVPTETLVVVRIQLGKDIAEGPEHPEVSAEEHITMIQDFAVLTEVLRTRNFDCNNEPKLEESE